MSSTESRVAYQKDAHYNDKQVGKIMKNLTKSIASGGDTTGVLSANDSIQHSYSEVQKLIADRQAGIEAKMDSLAKIQSLEATAERQSKSRRTAEEDETALAAMARIREESKAAVYEKLAARFNIAADQSHYKPEPGSSEKQFLERVCGDSQDGQWKTRKIIGQAMQLERYLASRETEVDQLKKSGHQKDEARKRAEAKAEEASTVANRETERRIKALEENRRHEEQIKKLQAENDRLQAEVREKKELADEVHRLKEQLKDAAAQREEDISKLQTLEEEVESLVEDRKNLNLENSRLAEQLMGSDSGLDLSLETPPPPPPLATASFLDGQYKIVRSQGGEETLFEGGADEPVREFTLETFMKESKVWVRLLVDGGLTKTFRLREEQDLQRYMLLYRYEQVVIC